MGSDPQGLAPLVALRQQGGYGIKAHRAVSCRTAGRHRKRTQEALAKRWAGWSALLTRSSFHRRERRRLQDRALDGGDDLPVPLALGPRREPGRIGHEGRPLLLALGQGVPGQEVVEVVV